MITKTMIAIIKDNLKQNALGETEIRRIESLGGTHISFLPPGEASTKDFNFLYTLTIDQTPYNIYDK